MLETEPLLQTHSVQTNGHDCGLWVLAWIAAILRGYETVASCVDENLMPTWRNVLGHLIRVMDESCTT